MAGLTDNYDSPRQVEMQWRNNFTDRNTTENQRFIAENAMQLALKDTSRAIKMTEKVDAGATFSKMQCCWIQGAGALAAAQ
ncbi:hypothetical protein [uncultured Massilia sp.]|uniref:hypothetical protein n=1 Tax=uncultured Massilia sp. TaxID=169973 RepID=UPI002601550A|nr:hypothetical protein [uncultured Massilia sp.]